MKFSVALGLVLVAAGALVLRAPQLDQRPLHTDEAVHAIKFLGLWERGEYRYDPHEYHGPSLYYATLPGAQLSGAQDRTELTESTLRFTSVTFGVGLVLLLLLVTRVMGPGATLWAAVFTAVSPAMVFYSRYFIHEMMLVAFTFSFLACLWRYRVTPSRSWMVAAGICLGLMHGTKETFLFPVAAAAGAWIAVSVWRRLRTEPAIPRPWRGSDVAWGGVAAAVVSVTLFTSFFQNWQGPLDAWRTYGPWWSRAEGASPHVHPWHYYWQVLLFTRRGSGPLWTEALIFALGLLGAARALGPGSWSRADRDWSRFLTFFTLGLSLIYTVIPYKTPWCVLGFWHGWILLAGIGAAGLVARSSRWPWRIVTATALALGSGHLLIQAQRAAFRYADSQRNPFVYAHTLSSVLDLVERVEGIVAAAPPDDRPVIKIMAPGGDYWPLPWYLRAYVTGWYPNVPPGEADAAADVLLAAPSFEPEIKRVLGERIQSLGMFGLRPGIFLQLHVEPGLWELYLDRQRPPAP